jgi:ribosome-binding factor A
MIKMGSRSFTTSIRPRLGHAEWGGRSPATRAWQTGAMPRGSSKGSSRSSGSGGRSSSRGRGFASPVSAGAGRGFARTARVNESLREVIAEELEEIGDERLELVTITGIDADADFRQAIVFYSALVAGDRNANAKVDIAEAFDQYRVRLQGAIGRQVRLKRTPLLVFRVDPAIEEGAKIESIISTLPPVVEQRVEEPVEQSTEPLTPTSE